LTTDSVPANPDEEFESFLAEAPPPSPRAAYRLFALGSAFEQRGDYAKAVDCARRSLAIIEPLLPGNGGKYGDVIRFRALGLLGAALRQQGDYAAADAPLLLAIELAETMPEFPDRAASAWNNLGVLCKFAGWFDRGEEAYRRALAFAERIGNLPERDMTTATILHNVGGLDHARGRFATAEEPSRRAWEIRRRHLGEDDPAVLADAVAYAAVLDGLGRYAESRPIYERALAVYERIFGPEHYETATTLHNLALVEHNEGHPDRAAERARRSYEIKVKLLGRNHPDTGLSAMNLASLLPAADADEADALLTEALRAFETALAPDHPHIRRCRQLSIRP
jgi:tetratricopeptide (TPR) repeat protein